jgi:hypothetical protein
MYGDPKSIQIRKLVDELASKQVEKMRTASPEFVYPSAYGALTAHLYFILGDLNLTKKQMAIVENYVKTH